MNPRFALSWKWLAVALALGTWQSAARADEAADPTGTWVMTAEMEDGSAVEVKVNITKEGDEYAGTFSLMDVAEGELKEIEVDGDKLKIEAVVDFGGQELIVKFDGKVTGDTFAGEVEYDLAGQIGTLEVEGAREKSEVVVAVGPWKFTIDVNGQILEPVATIVETDGELSGKFVGDDGQEVELTDLKLEGDTLSFAIELDFGGQPLIAKYSGKIDGDNYTGALEYDISGQIGELDFKAVREGAAGEATLAGDWQITIDAGGMVLQPTASIRSEDGKLIGTFVADDGQEAELSDLKMDGNKFNFTLTVDFGGQALNAKFDGELEGDKVSGSIDYEVAGETGEATFTGERLKPSIDLAGTWKLTIDAGGQVLEPQAIIKNESGELSGQFVADDGQQVELADLALEGDKVMFTITLDFGGQDLVAKFAGNVKEDEVEGEIEYDLSGQVGTATFTGAKQGAEAAGAIGKWNISVATDDGGSLESVLTLEKGDEGPSGTMVGPDGVALEVDELKVEGDKLAFKVTADFGGQELVANFDGKVEGDKYTGKVAYDLGGETGELDFEGSRATE